MANGDKARPGLKSIRLILNPAFNSHDQRLHGKFTVHLDDRQLCISRQPLLDGARILLAEGFDPETPIVTRHAGDAFDAMISTVGEAAKWTVRENETEGPRFVRWTAFPGVRGHAPMRLNERPVPNPTPDAEPPEQPIA
jgi:hypothetical protein